MANDTYTNSGNERERRASSTGGQQSPVPQRRGSKYVDILLQRLHATVFADNESVAIGMIGAAPRQGVTTLAANLSIRAADHFYKPSLIVDGNARNQKLSRMYRCSGKGLTDCLSGQASMEECVKKTKIPECFVMGAGNKKLSKQIMFDPDVASDFFNIIRNEFRFSTFDLPSLHEPSFVDSIVPYLDGVVLVARYGIRKDQLESAQGVIRKAGGRLLAAVMTGNDDKLPGWVPKYFG